MRRQYGIGQLINTISISFRSDACLLDEVVCFNCHADLQIKGRARRVARRAEHDFHHGRILIVRWLDRISRCYDKLHATMRRLMELGVPVEGTPNGMVFDGKPKDPIDKATRVSVLAFMAAQGEAAYRNRAEMQRRAVAIAKAAGKYTGRARTRDYASIREWRSENGAGIRETAEKFGGGTATVKRARAESLPDSHGQANPHANKRPDSTLVA